VRVLILVRHAEAGSNAHDVVDSRPPGLDLTPAGREEAAQLGEELARETIELGVATELCRTQETLELALQGRAVPKIVMRQLNEIDFGAFDGGPLDAYRRWAWTTEPDVSPPGGGESRAEAAARIADGLELLAGRPEQTILAVSHALPVRYVLDAADGAFPAAKITPVPHVHPYRLSRAAVETAAAALREWSEEPEFREAAV